MSMTSSVLVALNFADFRMAQKSMKKMSGKSFVNRHRGLLMFTAAFFTVFEVTAALLRRIPLVYPISNLIGILCGIFISGWFWFEARTFSKTLKGMAASSESASTAGGTGKNAVYKKMVRRKKVMTWAFFNLIFFFSFNRVNTGLHEEYIDP